MYRVEIYIQDGGRLPNFSRIDDDLPYTRIPIIIYLYIRPYLSYCTVRVCTYMCIAEGTKGNINIVTRGTSTPPAKECLLGCYRSFPSRLHARIYIYMVQDEEKRKKWVL